MPADTPCSPEHLLASFGQIDIYLFDQLLRGRITPRMRVLDAGCGSGRNAHYLLRCGADVFGIDADRAQVDEMRATAAQHAPGLCQDNFLVARLDDIPFPDAFFDSVICCAVLHFAADEADFEAMMKEMWRVLRPGGVFFARLASSIGIEDRVDRLRGRWHHLPDGSQRFLVDERYLTALTSKLGASLLDPLKTTNVQNMRAMTTWVLAKPVDGAS